MLITAPKTTEIGSIVTCKLQNGQEVLEQLSASPQISLFLSMDATDADVVKIREQLKKNTQIEKVEFIPRKTALETL